MGPLSAVISWARIDGVLRLANTVQMGNNYLNCGRHLNQ